MIKSILSQTIYLSVVLLPGCNVVLLSGCNEVESLNSDQFSEKWKSAEINSAVSWWYLGENEKQYFVSENMPLEKHNYTVSKSGVKFVGITAYKYKSGKEPVNLKINNVIFN